MVLTKFELLEQLAALQAKNEALRSGDPATFEAEVAKFEEVRKAGELADQLRERASRLERSGIEAELSDEMRAAVLMGTLGDLEPLTVTRKWRANKTRAACLVLVGTTGCITGSAMIGVNRAGKGFQLSLEQLVKRENGGVCGPNGIRWDPSIQTMVRARNDDGSVSLMPLIGAYESGIKPVLELLLADGKRVKATADHEIMTDSGWKTMADLKSSDNVFVEASRRPEKQGRAPRKSYPTRVVKRHPYAGRREVRQGGMTVPAHRLAAEAHANGMTLEAFVSALNTSDGLPNGTFFDPAVLAVHHVDENHLNNAWTNLKVMTHAAHAREHAPGACLRIRCETQAVAIVAIKQAGAEMTYDLAMPSPHNFIANGIVVHNCGKTVAAADAIADLGGLFVSARECEAAFASMFGEEAKYQERLLNARLLVVDDVGTERDKERMTDALTLILSKRASASRRPTILTANMTSAAFKTRYSTERLISRLTQSGQWVSIGSDKDLRRAKKRGGG